MYEAVNVIIVLCYDRVVMLNSFGGRAYESVTGDANQSQVPPGSQNYAVWSMKAGWQRMAKRLSRKLCI